MVRDDDGVQVHRIDIGVVKFTLSGPGRPLGANIIANVGGMPFPSVGDFTFEIVVDGEKAGEALLSIVDAPAD